MLKQLLICTLLVSLCLCNVTLNIDTRSLSSSARGSTDEEWAKNLRSEVEGSPQPSGYCKKQNPAYPLNNQSLCDGKGSNKNIGWLVDFTFEVSEATTYDFEFGVDMGFGGAVFVNDEFQVAKQGNLWWAGDWNSGSVFSMKFDFQPYVPYTVLVVGAENCCDGKANVRFNKNGGSWINFSPAALDKEIAFVPKPVEVPKPADPVVGGDDCKEVKYDITSAGFNFGDYLTMTLNGKTIIDTNDKATLGNNDQSRGFIVVQVNADNGDYLEHKIFDTHASSQKSKDMAAYINSIPEGTLVMTGVNDEGANKLESQGIAALKTVGAAADFKLNYRESYALVGIKGKVSDPWAVQQSTTSKVSIVTDLVMCPGKAPVDKDNFVPATNPDTTENVEAEGCPIIYSECNFQGKSMAICGAEPDIGEFNVKSVKVPKSYAVTLYIETEYEGEWVEYKEDQACIDEHQFNDPKFLLQNRVKVSSDIENLNGSYSSMKVQKVEKKSKKHHLNKNLRVSKKL